MKKISQSQLSMLNIIACIIVVIINAMINLILSPYIVKNLGVEANGFITLANNFISYFSLITIALNSMAGRFILIDLHKNNLKSANEYYTSVLIGNYIIAILFFFPCVIFTYNLNKYINVPNSMLSDIKILFSLTFINFFIGLLVPKWQVSTYVTNKLYLRSFENVLSAIIRFLCIYILFLFFKPAAYYVAIGGLFMTITNIICEFYFKKRLTPELNFHFTYYKFEKVKILISSGIWNTISKCGNMLLEGLDLILANLFVNPTAMGILSLSKILPNMLNQIIGNITTTFGPKLTHLYAEENIYEMRNEVKKDIKIISLLISIPIGGIIVYSDAFFKLWVPSSNHIVLAQITSLTCLGILFSAMGQCISNIFITVNKLKVNSIVVVISGILNVIIVLFLLKYTDLGIYAIAGVSSILGIFRELFFTSIYGAVCINAKWNVFQVNLLKSSTSILVPIIIGFFIKMLIPVNSWVYFFITILLTVIISFLFNILFILNKSERNMLFNILKIKK